MRIGIGNGVCEVQRTGLAQVVVVDSVMTEADG